VEYESLILKNLSDAKHERYLIQLEIHSVDLRLAKLETEMKFKSGLWGMIAGAIPAAIAIIYQILA